MDPPAGYRFRAPTADDLRAVADVLAADSLDEAGRVALDEHFVEDEWSRVAFDLASDAWVVIDEKEAIVAYGQAAVAEQSVVASWGVVHPALRGRGIGAALLRRIENRASELLSSSPPARFRHAVNAGDEAAAALLSAHGLRPIRHFWHMQIDLEMPFRPGPAPRGIEIQRIASPDGLPSVHAVLDTAFADHWGHESEPFDRWAEEQTTSPTYDPTLWLLATHEETPVGALTANIWGDRGWVDSLGVLAPSRGRGVGTALLRHSFATFADCGIRSVILSVDAENPTGATALYERVGMRIVWGWDLWERTLAASHGPPLPGDADS